MDRERFGISDAVWTNIAGLLPGKVSDRGVTARDNRKRRRADLADLRLKA